MELNGKLIAFLGDSITEGAGVSAPDKRYWEQVAKLTGAVCVGDGIGGTRIARQHNTERDPFPQHFVTRVGNLPAEADAVVVFGGTNDYGHGDAPLGTMADRTDDTFYGALHALFTALICRYPTVPVVVCTPLHRLNEALTVNEYGYRCAPLGTYVKIIREVAEYYSLPVVDFYAESGIQPEIEAQRETMMPDGLHPNDAGAARLAGMIVERLRRL